MDKTWRFNPLDTLFFRDGMSIEPGESGWLESIFPPTPATMQGAIRTRMLAKFTKDFAHKDGKWLCTEDDLDLNLEIGAPGDFKTIGRLKLSGPFLVYKDKRLYPAPLDLVKTEKEKKENEDKFTYLVPAENPIKCDLGDIRLPVTKGKDVKTLEGVYLTEDDMKKALLGEPLKENNLHLYYLFEPEDKSVNKEDVLADKEYRIGLARDNSKRTALDGHLYAISPVRVREDVLLEVDVGDVDERLQKFADTIQRFGAEGKLAGIYTDKQQETFNISGLADKIDKSGGCFKLVLVTPAKFGEDGKWLPNGFKKDDQDGWTGELNGIPCNLISACIGKPQKFGGWDFVKGYPKPMESYVPAGSVYFFKTAADVQEVMEKLKGFRLGEETALGYGQFLLGTWEDK